MSVRWARPWFAVTALCVVAGVALSVYTAVQTPGRFPTGVERGFNTFAFFTVQSNLWVSLLLLGLAAGATALDSRLGPRGPSGDLARAGAGHRSDLAG